MKSQYQLSILAIAIAALGTQTAQAITLEDYIDPNSRYEDAYINGSFRAANAAANSTGAEDAVDGANTAEETTGDSFNLDINVDYSRVNSTMERVKKVEASLGGSLSNDDNGTRDSIGADAALTYDKYFDSYPKAFWFGRAGVDYLPDVKEEFAADATVGVGYGRVINATPLAKTIRLVEELQKYGLLSAYPADDVMLRVAQLINKEDEYESRLGASDYSSTWYEDIVAEFKTAGILVDEGLGALGVIKIDQVLTEESISTRKHGWVARAGATAILQDHLGEDGEPAFSLGFEYAKPYGYRGQLIDIASYQLGDNSVFNNTLSYTYEISNTVDWQNSWDLTLLQPDAGEDEMVNTLSSGFSYEISNLLNLDTTLIVSDNDADDIDASAVFQTSLRYRLK